GTKNFKSAMEEIGLSTEAVQKGMSTDATGTLNKVIEAIGKLPESQRIGVMVELVGMEHSDTLAKLVDKPEELARQRALANGSEAKGSMAREAAARNAALSAQWQMTKNRAFNMSAVVGQSLVPALLSLMAVVNPLIEGLARWVQEHPVLVGWVMKLAIGGAALVAVLSALLLPLALIAGKAMLIRFLFARLSLAMGGQLAGALRLVGAAALNVGRALLFTPIGAIVAGIAVAALLIYKYWQPIAAFFSGIWTGFSDALAPAFAAVGNALAPLRPALDWLMGVLGGVWNWFTALLAPMQATEQQLQGISNMGQFLGQVLGTLVMGFLSIPQAFYQLGVDIIMGFVNGLTGTFGLLKDTVVGMASSVAGWFKEKLGINSPSRVFMEYGG
ncbi:phage tail tape measure protein, partial [Streptomyces sp. G35A]